MRIRPVSDLHIDVSKFELPELETDKESVLVVAGDLCEMGFGTSPWEGWFFKHCPRFKAVVFVMGNHESYGGNWGKALENVRGTEKKIPNLHVLNNEKVLVDDVTFLGSTLWTDCDRGNPMTYMRLKMGMADYSQILKFTPQMSHEEHKIAVEWLRKARTEIEGKVVVVTHHSPTRLSEDPKYKDSPIAGGFSSDQDELVYDLKVDLWIHGHIHYFSNYSLFGTRIVCNPRGYHSARVFGMGEDTGFKDKLTIEV